MNDASLRIRCDEFGAGPGRNDVNLWLSTYGMPDREVDEIDRHFDELLAALFAAD